MAVTLKDIAEQIGVSNQAVSAVLNSKTNCRVSKEKRARILKLARDLNYQANMSASILRGRRSKLIGIFVDSFARYRTLRLLQEIERLSSKRGYRIVTSFTHDNIAHMKADYLQFQRYGISDFICCAHDYPEFREEIADLFTGAENVVFMEKPCLPGMPYVRTSRVTAMTAMIADACRKGFRRFGNLYGHHAVQTEYMQRDEFKQALRNNGLDVDENLMFEFPKKRDVDYRIRQAVKKMILPYRPDFLYVDDFPYTITLRTQLEETGRKIMIHGGNGDPLFRSIKLNTFDPRYEKIAENLLDLLLHPELRTTVPVIEAIYKKENGKNVPRQKK